MVFLMLITGLDLVHLREVEGRNYFIPLLTFYEGGMYYFD